MSSQRPRKRLGLRIIRSPAGSLARPRAYPTHPYAGQFGLVEARGTVRRRHVRIRAWHVFRRMTIANRWHVRCRHRCRVQAYFPTWATQIVAVMRDGRRVPLGEQPIPLTGVERVALGRYRLTHLHAPARATIAAVAVEGEPTNPTPGPSLMLQVGGRRSVRLAARLDPLG